MPTSKHLRRQIRDALGVAVFGRLPLRRKEIEKAYEQMTGEQPDPEWSAAKLRHITLGKAHDAVDEELDREPYDASQPCVKSELQAMIDALEEADDSTADEETAEAGGDA